MNECLTTPQHEKQIGYWVSEKVVHHERTFLPQSYISLRVIMEFNVATEKGCILLGYWVSEKGSREKTTHRSVFADLKLNNFQNAVSICSAWKLKENHHHLKTGY